MTAKYTDDELIEGVRKSIEAHDFEATAAIMQLLALQAPDKAQGVLAAIDLARSIDDQETRT